MMQEEEKSKSKNNFLKFRNFFENTLSNKSKKYTGSDLFDWTSLIVLFGGGSILIVYFVYTGDLTKETAFTGFILWFTAFAIFRYTKETYCLKVVTRKQLDFNRDNYKKRQTIELIGDFSRDVRLDERWVLSEEFEKVALEKGIRVLRGEKLPYEDEVPLIRMENVLSYYEKSGLYLKEGLIDFNIYYRYFSITFRNIYTNKYIDNVITASREKDPNAFADLLYLKSRFESKNK